jgi:hypothetical protein
MGVNLSDLQYTVRLCHIHYLVIIYTDVLTFLSTLQHRILKYLLLPQYKNPIRFLLSFTITMRYQPGFMRFHAHAHNR